MDYGRVKPLVKLAHGIAQVGEDEGEKVESPAGGPRAQDALGERLAVHALHHHHVLIVMAIALHDARKVRQAHAAALRREQRLVRSAQTRLGAQVLAHERTQLGAAPPHEEDALRDLERPLLEHGVDAIRVLAPERVEVSSKVVFEGVFACLHVAILAEGADRSGSAPRGRRGIGGRGNPASACVEKNGVMAAGTSHELGFFSPLLPDMGSWQPESCHDPQIDNALEPVTATAPDSATPPNRRP